MLHARQEVWSIARRVLVRYTAAGYVARNGLSPGWLWIALTRGVGTRERLRDFRLRDPGARRRGPTRERAVSVGRDGWWSGVIAKPLPKLAIETKTPPDLSGGVSR